MPYEPQPGAPTSVWVGEREAQAYFDALGLSNLAFLAAWSIPRIVDVAALCSGPPPVASDFTITDLAAGYTSGAAHDAMMAKLEAFADRSAWYDYCRASSGPQPDPIVPQDPIPGQPVEPAPADDSQRLKDIWRWANFSKSQFVTRTFIPGVAFECTGISYEPVPQREDGEWLTECCGFEVLVLDAPVYEARSPGDDTSIWWNLGWITWGHEGYFHAPVRLNHTKQIIYPIVAHANYFGFNLDTGVTLRVTPLYPLTATEGEGP